MVDPNTVKVGDWLKSTSGGFFRPSQKNVWMVFESDLEYIKANPQNYEAVTDQKALDFLKTYPGFFLSEDHLKALISQQAT